MTKRLFDLVCSVAGLMVLWPAIVVCVVLIRLDSSGPGLFNQIRVGRQGRHFICRKLRTMRSDTGNLPTHLTKAGSITRIGAFLRRSKLDELPQLWNVLAGDMSLVGPRPCLPSQDELISARRRLGVDQLRPGITGVAQVQGIDMSDPQALAVVDAQYLQVQSFTTDFLLILQTIGGSGSGDRTRTDVRNDR